MKRIRSRNSKKKQIQTKYMLIVLTVVCILGIFGGLVFNINGGPLKTIAGYIFVPMQQGINNTGAWIFDKTNDFKTMKEIMAENEELKKKAEKKATQQAREKVENLKSKVERQSTASKSSSPAKSSSPSDKTVKPNKVLRDLSDLKILTKNPAKLIQEVPSSSRPLASSPHRLATSNVADELRRKKLSFSRELDIRGLRVDEALEALIAYMDDALMVNAEMVTILHGTGTGALKQVVRDYLAERQKSMRRLRSGDISFHDGDPDRGGAGITIVEL